MAELDPQFQKEKMRLLSLYRRTAGTMAVLLILAAAMGCSLSSPSSPRPGPQPSTSGSVPQFGHVVVVLEENHSYSEVIGNSAMPYLNSLASQYGLATQYFANAHPSIGNYFMLTTGQLVTSDDAFAGSVGADNIVRKLITAGKTWKSCAESIPSTGYTEAIRIPTRSGIIPFPILPMW